MTKIGDKKTFIAESSNEFKPKIGTDVEKGNKENNGKAYKDIMKDVEKITGPLNNKAGQPKEKYVKSDENKTTLDYNIANADEKYKKRVKAQVKGYTSESEMENGIEKADDYDKNEEIYNAIKKQGEEMDKQTLLYKKSGLKAREYPDETFKQEKIYENESNEGKDMRKWMNTLKGNLSSQNKKPINELKSLKTVYFKKTVFLNEDHMKSRIPDEFKVEGNQFIMKDKNDVKYIVEWNSNKANVIDYINERENAENMKQIKHLFNYNYSDYYKQSTVSNRLHENQDEVRRIMNIIRKIESTN